MADLSTCSRRGALVCALLALALLVPGAAVAAEREPDPLRTLGRTAVATLGSAGADRALDRITQNLAMLAAQERIAAHAEREAEEIEAEAAEPDTPDLDDYRNMDPSELPPASAGTNGSEQALGPRSAREGMFARMPPGADPETTSVLLTGIALPPPNAPQVVKDVINNANLIVGRPYVWGGGHGSFYSYGYDCSGAVSFALFGGGLIPRPATSGELEGYGEPGPGKWITIYANASHVYAEIAGLRWDTSGVESGTGPRWHADSRSGEGFVVRHPPGL